MLQRLGISLHRDKAGDYVLDGGQSLLSIVRWECIEGPVAGLPPQGCLERIVCAAELELHPERGPLVQAWLDSRGGTPETSPKAFTWSSLAGWYNDHGGYEAFLQSIWKDSSQSAALVNALVASNTWRVVTAVADAEIDPDGTTLTPT
jgi:hypothetical protein